MKIEAYQTLTQQIEFIPRLTWCYGDYKLIAFEWLWFGVYVDFKPENT